METVNKQRKVLADVTVAIITRNEAIRLPDLLDALLAGSVLPQAIVVVDNGSTDLSRQIVETYVKRYGEVSIHWRGFLDNNLGRSRAFALEHANTDRVAFVDADCLIPELWLERLTDAFDFYEQRFPELAGIGVNSRPVSTDPNLQRWLTLLQDYWLGHGGSPQAKFFTQNTFVDHLPTTCVMYCRSAVLRSGNFSENFQSVCEDVELSVRLRQHGFRLMVVPDLIVGHATSDTFLAWSERLWRFGWGQGWVQLAHPEKICWRFWAPAAVFHSFLLSLLLSSWLNSALLIPFIYFACVIFTAARISLRTRCWEDFSGSLILLLVTHFSYIGGAAFFLWQQMLPRRISGTLRSLRTLHSFSRSETG